MQLLDVAGNPGSELEMLDDFAATDPPTRPHRTLRLPPNARSFIVVAALAALLGTLVGAGLMARSRDGREQRAVLARADLTVTALVPQWTTGTGISAVEIRLLNAGARPVEVRSASLGDERGQTGLPLRMDAGSTGSFLVPLSRSCTQPMARGPLVLSVLTADGATRELRLVPDRDFTLGTLASPPALSCSRGVGGVPIRARVVSDVRLSSTTTSVRLRFSPTMLRAEIPNPVLTGITALVPGIEVSMGAGWPVLLGYSDPREAEIRIHVTDCTALQLPPSAYDDGLLAVNGSIQPDSWVNSVALTDSTVSYAVLRVVSRACPGLQLR